MHATSYDLKHDILTIYSGRAAIESLRLTESPLSPLLSNKFPGGFSLNVSQTASGIVISRDSYHSAGALPIHT